MRKKNSQYTREPKNILFISVADIINPPSGSIPLQISGSWSRDPDNPELEAKNIRIRIRNTSNHDNDSLIMGHQTTELEFNFMIIVLGGKSNIGAHVWSNIYYLACFRHLISSRAVTNRIFSSLENTYFPLCLRNIFWVPSNTIEYKGHV